MAHVCKHCGAIFQFHDLLKIHEKIHKGVPDSNLNILKKFYDRPYDK